MPAIIPESGNNQIKKHIFYFGDLDFCHYRFYSAKKWFIPKDFEKCITG